MKTDSLLPCRAGETDDERRLREALNRLCGQAMRHVDSAIRMRSPVDVATHTRHRARGHLIDFCATALLALHWSSQDQLPPEN